MDLAEFLNARLAEVEHFARVARLAQKHREQMLREVEAKRRILQRHKREAQDIWADQQVVGEGPPFCPWCSDREESYPWPCPDVRTLAAVYSDHPGYDPAWSVNE